MKQRKVYGDGPTVITYVLQNMWAMYYRLWVQLYRVDYTLLDPSMSKAVGIHG